MMWSLPRSSASSTTDCRSGAARERIDDWRAFFEAGLESVAHAALRVAERSGRLL